MILSITIPDSIAEQLNLDGEQGPRRALEMIVVAGYRTGELSSGQVREILDMELNEAEGFLLKHGCNSGKTFEEREQSLVTLGKLLDPILDDPATLPLDLPSDLSSNPAHMKGYGE